MDLSEIKKELISNEDKLQELLESFGFAKFRLRHNYELRFSRDDNPDSGPNISIRLKDNDNAWVKDFARNYSADIISFIITEKSTDFRSVLSEIRKLLNLDDYFYRKKTYSLFGGLYDHIGAKNENYIKVYDDSALDIYEDIGSLMFLKDGISLETQKFFGNRFDINTNRVIIPLYNEFHQLVGAKGRLNGEPDEYNPKYLYTIPVASSYILYGMCQNYEYLYGNDIVITEAEKSVQQAHSFGVRNVVALAGNSLSEKQTRLLMQLNPKRIIIALDEGLDFKQTLKNAKIIKDYCVMRDIGIWYWDSTQDIDIPIKASPTDMGRAKYDEIIREQLVKINFEEDL